MNSHLDKVYSYVGNRLKFLNLIEVENVLTHVLTIVTTGWTSPSAYIWGFKDSLVRKNTFSYVNTRLLFFA